MPRSSIPDAVGIWHRIVYTYADGCQIAVLEGEGFESKGKVPYIEGPLGKVYQGFECTIPNVMGEDSEMPPTPSRAEHRFPPVRPHLRAPRRDQGTPQFDAQNLGACALRLFNRTLCISIPTSSCLSATMSPSG